MLSESGLSYVEISKVLYWSDSSKSQLRLADGAEFVFGGDACDKGLDRVFSLPNLCRDYDKFHFQALEIFALSI